MNHRLQVKEALFRILDDPNNTKEISDLILDNTIFWLTGTWFTRKNDPENDVNVIIQQRTHEKDVSGYILERDTTDEWVKLILPMEFEVDRRSKTVPLASTKGEDMARPSYVRRRASLAELLDTECC